MIPPIKVDVIRNDRPVLVDSFLISAVLTVLALRVYLAAAHYPQLGGNGLHIAHVLWGGLLMVVAIGMLLSLLTWTWQVTGAVIGGVGFGLFIDELGKFLTSDNNYFFKPTASLVYAIFIVLFLTARELRHFRKLTARENLVNAIEASKQLALGPISNVIRNHALAWLDASDSSHPLTPFLHRQFELATATPERRSWLTAPVLAVRARYAAIVHNHWFPRVIVSVFVLQAVGVVLSVVYSLVIAAGAAVGSADAMNELNETLRAGPILWTTLAGTLISGVFTVIGVARLPRSRHHSYRAFETAVLIDLFLVQPFTLLDTGFAGLTQVFIDLALVASLRYLLSEEVAQHHHVDSWTPRPPAVEAATM
ncbi:MAG: hypothetical protein E6I30_09750 [Chloroflexi bacterium]|nr:MAG: hypothetical protein E6I30_09750 [Chloroflexota bacterium]